MQNLTEDNAKEFIKLRLKEKRYQHSINVMNIAIKLAEMYGDNVENAKFAALLHDCAKNMADSELIEYCRENNIFIDDIRLLSPGILHADVGADIAQKEFGANSEIVQAIKYHTLGNDNATTLDKIIYISDLIEEGRNLPGLDKIRKIVYNNLEEGYVASLEYCMINVEERGKPLHEQSKIALEAAKKRLIR